MFTATVAQAATYFFGVCLFSISFLVFLNSTISFVITDLVHEQDGVGNAVGTLGFIDELVALIACPLWGAVSDRIGVRAVCISGYVIIGLALCLIVQARNVTPQLLLARVVFSIGGAAATTMVTALLPSLTILCLRKKPKETHHYPGTVSTQDIPSITSENASLHSNLRPQDIDDSATTTKPVHIARPSLLAGIVGTFTGLGALLALVVFMPLPVQFRKLGMSTAQALVDTYYVVAATAFVVALGIFVGLKDVNGEGDARCPTVDRSMKTSNRFPIALRSSYMAMLWKAARLGLTNPLIGLGYLGGFVARASSVGITLFIPLYVNVYFTSSGRCAIDDTFEAKLHCRQAYILAAELTGASQLVALLVAPLFGFLSDRFPRFHLPLLGAAASGVVGYLSFASLDDIELHGTSSDVWVFVIVSLLGISQIGSIVGSLGLLSRGVLNLEDVHSQEPGPMVQNDTSQRVLDCHPPSYDSQEGECYRNDESAGLLRHDCSRDNSFQHLKGSIAGVYSLVGATGILLLTKVGGVLFDAKDTAAPFFLLAFVNFLLLATGIGINVYDVTMKRRT